MKRSLVWILFLLAGCALDNSGEMEVAVSFSTESNLQSASGATGPALEDFDCVFLNVMGPGIAPTVALSDFGAALPACIVPSLLSGVQPFDPENTVFGKISLLAGEHRTIQILAFKSNRNTSGTGAWTASDSDTGCPWSYLPAYFPNSVSPGSGLSGAPQIYEIGRINDIALYKDTSVEISNSYNSTTSVDLVQACPTNSAR